MPDEKKLYLIAIRPAEFLALKMFCARSGQTIISVATEAIRGYIANETGADFRHVAADSDRITMPNES